MAREVNCAACQRDSREIVKGKGRGALASLPRLCLPARGGFAQAVAEAPGRESVVAAAAADPGECGPFAFYVWNGPPRYHKSIAPIESESPESP